jgi:hypothetical protein
MNNDKLLKELIKAAPRTKKEMRGGSAPEERITQLVFNFYLFSRIFFPMPLTTYQSTEQMFMSYLLNLGLTPGLINLYTSRFQKFYKEMFQQTPITYHSLFFRSPSDFPFQLDHYYPYVILGDQFPISYLSAITLQQTDLLYVRTMDGKSYMGSHPSIMGKTLILGKPEYSKTGWNWKPCNAEPVINIDSIIYFGVYRPLPGVIVN